MSDLKQKRVKEKGKRKKKKRKEIRKYRRIWRTNLSNNFKIINNYPANIRTLTMLT